MVYQHILSKLSARLEKIENELIAQISSSILIENALLLGNTHQTSLLQSCCSQHRHLACDHYPRTNMHSQTKEIHKLTQFYLSHFTDLPYAKESMDFIILPHVLEFSKEPKVILHEAYECLSERGSLLIFSFSPLSRFTPLVNSKNKARFSPLSLSTTKQLLTETDWNITASQSFFSLLSYMPETKPLPFIEKFVMPYLPFLCNAYWIIAQKNSAPHSEIPLKCYTKPPQTIALESGCAARTGNS